MQIQEKVIEKVKKYLQENIQNDVQLDVVAREAGYSKFHLNRIFAEKEGITIYRYLQAKRLEAAAKYLTETDKSIIEIACEVNYGSQQAFTTAFRQRFHDTPDVYRKKYHVSIKSHIMFRSLKWNGGMAA